MQWEKTNVNSNQIGSGRDYRAEYPVAEFHSPSGYVRVQSQRKRGRPATGAARRYLRVQGQEHLSSFAAPVLRSTA